MNAAPDMIVAGLKMLAALGGVLALIFILLHGLRKMSGGRGIGFGAKNIQVLERYHLGVKKSIALVRVPGRVLVLGVCADRIDLLDKLDENLCAFAKAENEKSSFAPLLDEQLRSSAADTEEEK